MLRLERRQSKASRENDRLIFENMRLHDQLQERESEEDFAAIANQGYRGCSNPLSMLLCFVLRETVMSVICFKSFDVLMEDCTRHFDDGKNAESVRLIE